MVGSSPANAGDVGLIPGSGRFHMPRDNHHMPSTQPLNPVGSRACALQQEKTLQGEACALQLERSPHSLQPEKACALQ